MSEFFVKTFNKRTPCAHCKHAKLVIGKRVYSLCEAHLDEARERWRCWQEQRRAEGKCISCDCKSFHGWLRCRKHTLINRERCKRWVVMHKEHQAQRHKERKEYWFAQGLCVCGAHNPLTDGYRRCDDCRSHRQQLAA